MKAYALAKDASAFRNPAAQRLDDHPVRYSKVDYLHLANGCWLAVFEEPSFEDIRRVRAAGAVFLPPMDDLESSPSPEFLAMIPAAAGLTANDTPLRAAKKIYAHTRWGPHNPLRW